MRSDLVLLSKFFIQEITSLAQISREPGAVEMAFAVGHGARACKYDTYCPTALSGASQSSRQNSETTFW